MSNSIKRNKLILDYLNKQLVRLNYNNNKFVSTTLAIYLTSSTLLKISKDLEPIKPVIFDNDEVLIETLKLIGIMEISVTLEDFKLSLIKRDNIKSSKKELSDFDHILKGIMKVPNQ